MHFFESLLFFNGLFFAFTHCDFVFPLAVSDVYLETPLLGIKVLSGHTSHAKLVASAQELALGQVQKLFARLVRTQNVYVHGVFRLFPDVDLELGIAPRAGVFLVLLVRQCGEAGGVETHGVLETVLCVAHVFLTRTDAADEETLGHPAVFDVKHLLENEREFVGPEGNVLVLVVDQLEGAVSDAVLEVHETGVNLPAFLDAFLVVGGRVCVAFTARQVDQLEQPVFRLLEHIVPDAHDVYGVAPGGRVVLARAARAPLVHRPCDVTLQVFSRAHFVFHAVCHFYFALLVF
mmetsp:Transcript_76680/g.165961  ORF Transcript_76680/g.165961 Transcript_76680/m.165961 type:complete len:291 (-) Transcript_76680:259-1131(-)